MPADILAAKNCQETIIFFKHKKNLAPFPEG
jgi:hypothetical protein